MGDSVSTAALLDLIGLPNTTGNSRRIAATMRALGFIPIKSRRLEPGGYRDTVTRGWARPLRNPKTILQQSMEQTTTAVPIREKLKMNYSFVQDGQCIRVLYRRNGNELGTVDLPCEGYPVRQPDGELIAVVNKIEDVTPPTLLDYWGDREKSGATVRMTCGLWQGETLTRSYGPYNRPRQLLGGASASSAIEKG